MSLLAGAYNAFDARRRGANPIAWGLAGLLFGLIGVLVWLVVRRARASRAVASTLRCAQCRAPLTMDLAFCAQCGAAREPSASASAPVR